MSLINKVFERHDFKPLPEKYLIHILDTCFQS